MKLSRPLAAAIGVAVVAISGLAFAAPASAATSVTFVTASDFGTFGPSSSAPGTWNEIGGAPITSGISGLSATGGPELVYTLPAPIAITGSALVDAAAATSVHTSNNANSIPFIFWRDEGGVVQRFQANASGDTFSDPSTQWTSTISVNGSSSGTLSAFAADFAADPFFDGSEIVAFEIYLAAIGGGTFYTFTVNGTDFSFMPTPVVTGAAAQITRDAFVSTGYPVTASGFVPGETVTVYSGTATGGTLFDTAVADVNGVVSYTWIAPSSTPQGAANRTLTLVGDDTGVVQFFDFSVTATAGGLAATGADAEIPLLAGGVLLLGGVALAIVAAKRRRTV